MKSRLIQLLLVLNLAVVYSANVRAETDRQIGLGFGAASTYPVTTFPSALMAVVEGTYRWKYFGLAVLGAATSSQKVGGTYWFGSQGGYEQAFLEPRLYLSIVHLGVSFGLNLSQGTSGVIQTIPSYGPMLGIEIPLGRFSLGVDGRYLFSSGSNATPLSTVLMGRFRF